MHDDIGSILTQVSQLSDLGQSEAGGQPAARGQFERIGTQARAAVQALDEIVWATNPKNDNLPRFAEYVCRFADEFFEDTAVRCWQEVPTDLPNVPLGAEAAAQRLPGGQGGLQQRAETLRREGSLAAAGGGGLPGGPGDRGQRTRVQSSARPPAGGNGLANMIARLAECGGQAEIISQAGQGAKLRFSFPLTGAGG